MDESEQSWWSGCAARWSFVGYGMGLHHVLLGVLDVMATRPGIVSVLTKASWFQTLNCGTGYSGGHSTDTIIKIRVLFGKQKSVLVTLKWLCSLSNLFVGCISSVTVTRLIALAWRGEARVESDDVLCGCLGACVLETRVSLEVSHEVDLGGVGKTPWSNLRHSWCGRLDKIERYSLAITRHSLCSVLTFSQLLCSRETVYKYWYKDCFNFLPFLRWCFFQVNEYYYYYYYCNFSPPCYICRRERI